MNVLKKRKKLYLRIGLLLLITLSIILYVNIDTFKEIVNIILVSFIGAYILKPVKKEVVKKFKCKDSIASIIIILAIVLAVIVGIIICIPMLFKELNNIGPIVENLYLYIDELGKKINIANSAFIRFIYEEGRMKLGVIFELMSQGIIDKVMYLGENLLSIAIIPVLIYYFLADSKNISKKFYLLIPVEKRNVVKNIANDIDKLLGRYIISQVILSLIIGILTFIALIILKVRFPLWLSILNGIFNIVPYFGPVLGGVPIIFIALLDSTSKGIWVTIAMLVIQQFEGNILSPKITGDSTNMHPLIIVILLLIGEKFGGFIGMIFIIPIGVIVKVIYDDINYYIF